MYIEVHLKPLWMTDILFTHPPFDTKLPEGDLQQEGVLNDQEWERDLRPG